MSSSPTKDVVTALTATSTSAAATGCKLLKIKVTPEASSSTSTRANIRATATPPCASRFKRPNPANAAAAGGIRTNVRFRMVNLQPYVPPTNEVRCYATSFHGTRKAEYRCFTFIRHDVLARQWFCTDDEFTIHCDVAVVEEAAAAATMSTELGPDDLDGLMMICKCSVDNDDEPCKSSTRQSLKEAFRKHFLGCFGPK
ncbi:hypothetical protein OsJ_21329 [Oryza sativa Japonica Group]|uniref:Uncharacterized protein n=1 Tax=Oryza sativa subsp. japonica TaxID=39947 RepID=B9FT87_ORYSJ|nr:hypothetical protein OsJ_21329 [Oryza sativa Japonica Group]